MDALGRIESAGGTTWSWTAGDELAGATTADGDTIAFWHDAYGRPALRREWAEGGSAETQTLYAYAGTELVGELRDQDSTVYLAGRRGGEPLGYVTGDWRTIEDGAFDEAYAYARTLNGDVIGVIDATDGSLVEAYEYSPYGETTVVRPGGTSCQLGAPLECEGGGCLGPDRCQTAVGNSLGYQGAHFDIDVGAYRMGVRWFKPELNQWLSRDPLGFIDGFDPWLFVGGDPFNYVDPSGLERTQPDPTGDGDPTPSQGTEVRGEENRAGYGKGRGDCHIFNTCLTPEQRELLPDPPATTGTFEVNPFDWCESNPDSGLCREDGLPKSETELIEDFCEDGGLLDAVGVLCSSWRIHEDPSAETILKEVRDRVVDFTVGKVVGAVFLSAKVARRLWRFVKNGCFVAGTLVAMADGSSLSIEEIEVGMLVSAPEEIAEEPLAVPPLPAGPAKALAGADPRSLQTHFVGPLTALGTRDGVVVQVVGLGSAHLRSLIGSRYAPGNLHGTDVSTLWQHLSLDLHLGDGGIARLTLLRPDWWIRRVGAYEGSWINLEVAEAGLAGTAIVNSTTPYSGASSWELHHDEAIVIATIQHDDVQALDLVFDGEEASPLGATPNHPLYSLDRNQFVAAGELQMGERVRTDGGGDAVLTALQPRPHVEPVFNLEVHDVQAYFVGGEAILAHNTGANCYVDLVGFRRAHILNRHGGGAGISGKSEFPASWSDDRIIHEISDVATDPNSVRGVGRYGGEYAIGFRDGVEIRVDFYPPNHPRWANMISTGYPTNLPLNP